MGEDFQVEARDDAEVVPAALESDKEVRMECSVCVDDVTGSQDDFEVRDVVADPAALRRKEADAS